MVDNEKAVELSNGSLDKDKASSKSRQSADNSTTHACGDQNEDIEANVQLHDLENGSKNEVANEETVSDPNIVDWQGDNDAENPMNWTFRRKVWMSAMASFMTFGVSFASSVFSACTEVTAKEYNVSKEVMVLGVSLYVLGFACGKIHRTILSGRPKIIILIV